MIVHRDSLSETKLVEMSERNSHLPSSGKLKEKIDNVFSLHLFGIKLVSLSWLSMTTGKSRKRGSYASSIIAPKITTR